MDKKLTEFVALLRNNGVRASPPEVADAAHAIALTGYANRALFQTALCSTLAKSQHDAAIFDRCFASFFNFSHLDASTENTPRSAESNTQSNSQNNTQNTALNNPLNNTGNGAGGGAGDGAGMGGGNGESSGQQTGVASSALAEQLLSEPNNLAVALAAAVNTAQLLNIRVLTQKGLFARRILMAMGLEDFERELRELEAKNNTAAQNRAEQLRTKQKQLREQIRETVNRYFQLARSQDQESLIGETDFALLRENKAAQAVIKRMAKKLITQHRRRDKKSARGVLDVRATLRGNQAYDGILINPHWRRVRKDKPRVMAICDVSRSVSQHARFLLLFLYSLQEVIPRLRAFAFASTLHEVTALFDTLPVEAAVEEVMERHGFGSTDYGRAFADLEQQALSSIDKRTTLIILGDARNNNGDARVDLLREFHLRAKQVIWLNPESMNRWGSGDSEMLRYRSSCTRAHSCRNLNELARIVDKLLISA